jgi:ribonuclease PH
MDGNMTKEEIKRAIEMAKKAGQKISDIQKAALKLSYERTLEKYKI